jgi:hypothetical protein
MRPRGVCTGRRVDRAGNRECEGGDKGEKGWGRGGMGFDNLFMCSRVFGVNFGPPHKF